jgi:hypothetical protein
MSLYHDRTPTTSCHTNVHLLGPLYQVTHGVIWYNVETTRQVGMYRSIHQGQVVHRSLMIILKQIKHRQHGESISRPQCSLTREVVKLHPHQCGHIEGSHVRNLTLPQMHTDMSQSSGLAQRVVPKRQPATQKDRSVLKNPQTKRTYLLP